jgi:anaerobic magnesium-protoporphyrin IX monomethyl ester cyclase
VRFLLINPYYSISETPSPPLGLAYLAAALERAGVKVKILDFVVFPYSKEALESTLTRFAPHMVGVTAVTMTFDHAVSVLRDVKSINSDILTVMGGPHVTFCARDSMEQFPEVDFVVLGEGEETVTELAREAGDGREWSRINGLVYRHGPEITVTGHRSTQVDVDALPPPARYLLPLGRYRALGMPISMTTSRGCPFKCIFCVGRKMVGPKVRYRSPEKIVDELEYLSGLNFHQINIADDLFTARKRHCLEVCREITERKLDIRWSCFARVDTVSRDVLAKMKETGCCAISFGVESGNPEILRTIKKGITLHQVMAAISMCHKEGITPHVSFILGLPGETPATLKETLEFAERLKGMGASYGFHLLAPFPGTEVRDKSDMFGLKILTQDWTQYHANRAIVETSSVNREMLDDIAVGWERGFDEMLGEIKRLRRAGAATEEQAWLLTRLEHTVLIYDLMMEEIIEKSGFWHPEEAVHYGSDPLKALAEKVVRSTAHPREQVVDTLNFAAEQGYLKFVEDRAGLRWKWVDYLKGEASI